MKMFDNRAVCGFIVYCVFLFILHVACDTSSSTEPEAGKVIEIVEPLTGDELSRLNNNKLVVRFNPNVINVPLDRYFSFDQIEWKRMNAKVIGRGDVALSDTTKYRYEVMLWKPIDDTLQTGDSIYIKVNSYANQTILHTIGPVTID